MADTDADRLSPTRSVSGRSGAGGAGAGAGAGADGDGAAGGSSDAPWECIAAMIKGAPLCKFGRRGDPHYRNFALSVDGKYLSWYSHKKSAGASRVMLSECHLTEGQQTDVFRRQSRPDFADVSFSLLYSAGKRAGLRSLDVVCKDRKEFNTWVRGLRYLTTHTVPPEAIRRKCGDVAADTEQETGTSKPKHSDITTHLKKKLADTNDVYAFGFNGWGQLGLNDEAARHTPQLINSLLGKAVKQVACGSDHSGAVTDTGEVYMWGNGANGRLGLGSADAVMVPALLSNPTSRSSAFLCKSICCGSMHTLGITIEGAAYSWGCNANGQLGHGDRVDLLTPGRISLLAAVAVAQVDAGFDYSAAIDENGALYTWGNGSSGVLGHGDDSERLLPSKCSALESMRVISVSCGDMHMAALTEAHEAFTWGWNGCGQLGHGDFDDRMEPTRVEALGSRVSSIACGAAHTAATVYGDDTESWLYGWGAASQGQLGHKDRAQAAGSAEASPDAAGGSTTPALAGADTGASAALEAAAGSGAAAAEPEQSGSITVALPRVVDCMRGLAIAHVACGSFHTAALTESGVLYTYGDNQSGQLGQLIAPSAAHGKAATVVDAGADGSAAVASPSNEVRMSRAGSTVDEPEEAAPDAPSLTELRGPQPAANLDNKVVRYVSCGARHTCVAVATMWINDEETKTCMRCTTTFTTFVRRHHCRNCGGIFCGKCSSRRRPLLKLGFINPVRVCEGCYHRLQRTGS